MPTPAVIDLSHWQTIPSSLVPAREAGIVGLIHKGTEGASYVDDKLEARAHLAREAGLLCGVYHFLRPGDMVQQATHFVNTVRPGLDGSLLVAADHEDPGVSLDDLAVFLEIVEDLAVRSPVIYSGHVLKEQLAAKPEYEFLVHDYRLWLCHYTTGAPVLPPGCDRYWLWQYTDTGTCPGVDPPTDLNAIHPDMSMDIFRLSWSGREVDLPLG